MGHSGATVRVRSDEPEEDELAAPHLPLELADPVRRRGAGAADLDVPSVRCDAAHVEVVREQMASRTWITVAWELPRG